MPIFLLTRVTYPMDVHIKVKPNSRQNRIFIKNGEIVVQVTAPPADGEANRGVILYLASIFDIPKSTLTIAAGAGSRFKKISIPSAYTEKVQKVLDGLEGV